MVVVGSVVVVGGDVVVGGEVVVGGDVVVGGEVVVGGDVVVGATVVVDDCGTAGKPVNGGVVGLEGPELERRRAAVVGGSGAGAGVSGTGGLVVVVVVVVVSIVGIVWGSVIVNVVVADGSPRRADCGELLPALAADTPSGRRMAASMPTTIFCQRSIASARRRGRARGLGAQQGEAQIPDRARQPEVAHVARDGPVLGP